MDLLFKTASLLMSMVNRLMRAGVLLGFVVLVGSISGCKKANRSTESAEDIAAGEALISDLWRVAHQFIIFSQFTNGQQPPVLDSTLSYCFTYDPVPPRSAGNTVWPRVITVDFDNACTDLDGHARQGRMQIELTNWLNQPNTQVTITTDRYFVDGNSLAGTMVLTYATFSGGVQYAEVSDFNITTGTGGFFSLSNTFSRTLSQGFGSQTAVGGDLYTITGEIEGVNKKGDAFSATIVEPLFFENGCPYIKEGVVEIFPANGDARTLDFGQGDCDPEFSVNIDGRFFHREANHY